jgi:acetyltransferase
MMLEAWPGPAGTQLDLRPVEETDCDLLEAFAKRLSFRTRYFRYGRGSFELTADQIRQISSPDAAYMAVFVVLHRSNAHRSIVGVGRLVYSPGATESELTVTVGDSWQRRGVGRRLLDCLIDAARHKGHVAITARILATNQPMLTLVTRRGFSVSDSEQGASVKLAKLAL